MHLPPLNLGFIGGSMTSAVGYTHYIASQMDHCWAVVSGCFSRSQQSSQQTADKWGIENSRVYSDWRKMLSAEQGRLDAIAILTPTDQHAEIVIEALNCGFNVICEKALATSVADAERIIVARQRAGRFLAVTYNYTGYPMIRELCGIIANGDLGKINQIHVEMPQEGFARLDSQGNKPVPQSWRLTDGVVPTISLDLGVHLHSMAHMLTGQKPIKVISDQSSFGWFPHVIDNVMCIAKYTGGLKCQMWYSKSALGHRNGLRIRVYGDAGSAEWFQMNPEELSIHTIRGDNIVRDRASKVTIAQQPRYNRFKAGHPAGFMEAFANLYVDLADGLKAFNECGKCENGWVFGPEVALEGLRMFEAIDRSARQESWHTLDSNDISSQSVG